MQKMYLAVKNLHLSGISCRPNPCTSGVVFSASKPGKGFGTAHKQTDENSTSAKDSFNSNKRVVKDATAAAAAARSRARPVKPEEAARGKLDYVQVADWGDGDRARLGDLRLVSHTPQYAGGGSEGGEVLPPLHKQLAQQLKLAEDRGALAVAGPPPPPLEQWSFREGRYVQYLVDLKEVHAALETALLEAVARAGSSGTSPHTPDGHLEHPPPPISSPASPSSSPSTPASQSPPPAPGNGSWAAPAVQCARLALQHLAPGRLGLERSAALRRDLTAMQATAPVCRPHIPPAPSGTRGSGQPPAMEDVMPTEKQRDSAQEVGANGAVAAETVATAGADEDAEAGRRERDWEEAGVGAEEEQEEAEEGRGAAGARGVGQGVYDGPAGLMARSYAQVLERLGRDAAGGETEQERQSCALRLLAHAAVIHLVGQAAGVRLGAVATERLELLQRRAAGVYHEYPDEVTDSRATLARALDAAGEHIRSPAARQVVFDEIPSAMQKTGLLLSAVAHRD